mgnify:CR=1 FL=1
MVARRPAKLAAAVWVFWACAGGGQQPALPAFDPAGLSSADQALLENPSFHWQRLQTEHFVLHHEQKIFAAKVARLGEQFYAAISADLPSLQDHLAPRPSHIFIFRDPRDWQAWGAHVPGLGPGTISFVRSNVMYLQETGGDTSVKMGLLAHEMTHLVFNRFLSTSLPLWLNEGLAEYYGEFAYRSARGMGQSRRSAFRPLRTWTPLSELFAATTYPNDLAANARFYVTSKYLVGFLLLELPPEKWNQFFSRVLSGEPALPALLTTYGWTDTSALERDFLRFIH